jgi:trehalose 6-phosphate phosphatase
MTLAGSPIGEAAGPEASIGSTSTRQGVVISLVSSARLPRPPSTLLNGASLFLDLDGTLLELLDRPDAVVADEELRALLAGLGVRLDGRIAIISGRSLTQLDAILGPVAQAIALSGSHGCEHRWRGATERPERPASLDAAGARFAAFAAGRDGVVLEEKSLGVALHFRLAPAAESDAHALAVAVACDTGLELQAGKMMVELRCPGGDKGDAVRRLMAQPPMAKTVPVFVGDDLTDEPAFLATQSLGGAGVLVGPARTTAAGFRLGDPAAVRAWLWQFLS